MTFGNTFEEVSRIGVPEPVEYAGGHYVWAIREKEFSLRRVCLKKGGEIGFNERGGETFLVESGKLFIKRGKEEEARVELKEGSVGNLSEGHYDLLAAEDSLVYVFSGSSPDNERKFEVGETFDVRDKYWGKIESIASQESYAGKRIFMKEGCQSSLEYHVHKKEAYYIESGKLKVGLRVGRAENRSVILNPGNTFIVNPGTMHMRIALEDTVIMEVSTKDDDSDSHIVEDGKTYVHKEVNAE